MRRRNLGEGLLGSQRRPTAHPGATGVTSGPRLGDIESGAGAGAAGARFSVLSGDLLCLLGAVAIVAAFPALARHGSDRRVADQGGSASPGATSPLS